MYSVDALALSPSTRLCFSGELNTGEEAEFFGSSSVSKPASDRVYDLASLTKVMVTSCLLVSIAQKQKASSLRQWASSQRVADLLVALRGTPLEQTTVLDLWEHRSGLAPVVDLKPERPHFFSLDSAHRTIAWEKCLEQILELQLGKSGETLYSDCGYLLLGAWIEILIGKRLDALFSEWQQEHLLRSGLCFHPNHEVNHGGAKVLATESRHQSGEVNDDKAYFLGGVAPHAGLFGSVDDVMKFAQHILSLSRGDSLWHEWLFQKAQSRFCLGWDTASQQPGSPAGETASLDVRGHLGYTGTALWIDPKSQKIGVLLSNRVVPQATDINKESIRKLRSLFFDGLWQGTL